MKIVTPKLNLLTVSLTAIMALSLTACGGGSSSTNKPSATVTDDAGATDSATFSESATWTVNGMNDGETCYDFDSKSEVDCTGINWDIKYDKKGRSTSLWTNSGTSGEGNGGVLEGLTDWSKLKKYPNATMVDGMDLSSHYKMDSTKSTFGEDKWYEYNLNGGHQIYPNNKVYLVTTDISNASSSSSVQIPVYAMQVINYYNDAGTSGHPTLRWIDTAMPNKVKTIEFDASSQWAYVNLATGETTTKEGKWQVALQRYNIKLNGGDSGTGKVGGYMAMQPTGFYDADNKAITAKFSTDNAESTLNDLTNTDGYSSDNIKWVSDSFSSVLNPSATGTYPNLDYSWYTYDGVSHQLSAKPEAEAEAQGALIRSGEGNSYARVWLKELNQSTGEWTFEMDVQPVS